MNQIWVNEICNFLKEVIPESQSLSDGFDWKERKNWRKILDEIFYNKINRVNIWI